MNVIDFIINDKEPVLLNDIFLDEANKSNFEQLIKENTYQEELRKYGLPVNNKVLLHGKSGCGKTMSAKAIANALQKKILILNLSTIIRSRIGETSQNLKMIFDKAGKEQAVLFLDEFDQIGKERSTDDKDVGEMRRLVNTLLQLIDYYPENAVLIAATNHPELIDQALLRRFQLQLNFELPSRKILDQYYDKLLSALPAEVNDIPRKYDLSFAEAKDYAFTLAKGIIIKKLEAEAGIINS
ncbi:ATP-binding protein [Pedobacter gandavensis]|uniref:AAA family ATPase n=1 Tax=Pedobacter gandavensis TaxID=2679963 RepID=UPI0029306C4A|nr:ATP-binding protein [Pedobacter gandavensis]